MYSRYQNARSEEAAYIRQKEDYVYQRCKLGEDLIFSSVSNGNFFSKCRSLEEALCGIIMNQVEVRK